MFPISDSIKTNKFPTVTLLIIIITSVVFYQQLVSPDLEGLIGQFALIPANVSFASPVTWTSFVTAIFLHGGFLHIITNMWFFWVFGDDVEAFLGSFFFLLLYLFSGVAGNFLQYILMPESTIPMLGASGSIAGILGAYYLMFPRSTVKTLVFIFFFVTLINIPAPFMLGYWFVLQIISGIISTTSPATGGIAFFAHVGGFMVGFVIALIIKAKNRLLTSVGPVPD